MDDLNNNNNPFDEQKPDNTPPIDLTKPEPSGQGGQAADPYNQPAGNPYNMPQGDPYNQQGNPYNQPQGNPYAQQQPPQGNPYNQQVNPYNQQGNPYNQQGNPYNQQAPQGQSPYAMPSQQSPYSQPGAVYGQPAYGAPYQPYQNQSTGMAVASLVLGIISIVFSLLVFTAPFLIIVPIIGLILGIVFKSKHLPVGKGLSTAGIITSVCGIILPILILILVMVLMMNHSLDGFMSDMLRQIKATDPELYQEYYDMLGESFPEWFDGILFVLGLK